MTIDNSDVYADTHNCVIGTRPHSAHVGHLCAGHLQKLADTLRGIEEETAHLSIVPSFAQRSGRGGSLASQRSPIVLDALVLADTRRNAAGLGSAGSDPWAYDDTPEVLETLASWARLVREERGLSE